ncbi:hypothetical protein [Herpetosiphon llansteffanensis]|uniref:hypothetical protein n=1 Tax=Herpetosiphon llansteffanensis TaxID=2094568 RepID=UPI000D7D2158|nr:hypothetical protein [Herpetosiphon llansteffanensis]
MQTFFQQLRQPKQTLADQHDQPAQQWPYRAWLQHAGLAVGGSLIYGGSLQQAVPQWSRRGAAGWLTISAGAGWLALGPALVLASRGRINSCIQACLVSMSYGETILLIGALLNYVLKTQAYAQQRNLLLVLIANITMASTLAEQLSVIKLARWQTWLLWMLLLNGTGAVCFYRLRHLLAK